MSKIGLSRGNGFIININLILQGQRRPKRACRPLYSIMYKGQAPFCHAERDTCYYYKGKPANTLCGPHLPASAIEGGKVRVKERAGSYCLEAFPPFS